MFVFLPEHKCWFEQNCIIVGCKHAIWTKKYDFLQNIMVNFDKIYLLVLTKYNLFFQTNVTCCCSLELPVSSPSLKSKHG